MRWLEVGRYFGGVICLYVPIVLMQVLQARIRLISKTSSNLGSICSVRTTVIILYQILHLFVRVISWDPQWIRFNPTLVQRGAQAGSEKAQSDFIRQIGGYHR